MDRFGSRVLVSAYLAGMGLSFLALSIAPGVAVSRSRWHSGAAASVYHPAGLTLISNGVEKPGQGFAYHGVAGNVGIAGGPLVTAIYLLAFG